MEIIYISFWKEEGMLATIMTGLCYIACLKQMAFYFYEVSDLDSILPSIYSLV